MGYLTGLFEAEFADFVLEFDDLGGLHEGGLARGGEVVDKAADLSLGGGAHRDEELAVPDGDRCVVVDYAFGLGAVQNGGCLLGDGSFLGAEFLADVEKLV